MDINQFIYHGKTNYPSLHIVKQKAYKQKKYDVWDPKEAYQPIYNTPHSEKPHSEFRPGTTKAIIIDELPNTAYSQLKHFLEKIQTVQPTTYTYRKHLQAKIPPILRSLLAILELSQDQGISIIFASNNLKIDFFPLLQKIHKILSKKYINPNTDLEKKIIYEYIKDNSPENQKNYTGNLANQLNPITKVLKNKPQYIIFNHHTSARKRQRKKVSQFNQKELQKLVQSYPKNTLQEGEVLFVPKEKIHLQKKTTKVRDNRTEQYSFHGHKSYDEIKKYYLYKKEVNNLNQLGKHETPLEKAKKLIKENNTNNVYILSLHKIPINQNLINLIKIMIDTKKLHIIKAQKRSRSVSYLDIIINQQQHVWKKNIKIICKSKA